MTSLQNELVCGLAILLLTGCMNGPEQAVSPTIPVETSVHTAEEDGDNMQDKEQQNSGIIVGAIRWDAWHGELGEPGLVVERSLSPEHWHDRLPFFAEVISDTKVVIRGDAQEVMDQEIIFASEAGLDYWAFVTYDPQTSMSISLHRYLASAYKDRIHFCMIVEGGRIGQGGMATWQAKVDRYISYFTDPAYQMVLGNRPLFYIFNAQPIVGEGYFASYDEARAALTTLREATVQAGLGTPYIVIQSWSEGQARMFMQFLRADAISAYASSAGDKHAPYTLLATHTEAWWDKMAETGAPVIPLVSAGWDRRPRVENPVPWEGQQGSIDEYYERPTPAELAAHLHNGLQWVEDNPEVALARAVLIYAWNENDEGGWIVPTLSEGSAHLDAIGEVLNQR